MGRRVLGSLGVLKSRNDYHGGYQSFVETPQASPKNKPIGHNQPCVWHDPVSQSRFDRPHHDRQVLSIPGPLQDREAEKCLCNLARLGKPGGYLTVFGLDLDFRTRRMKSQGYIPVPSRIEEIHSGDRAMLDCPWTWWGLEPLDKTRADWQTRYAVVFQVPVADPSERLQFP